MIELPMDEMMIDHAMPVTNAESSRTIGHRSARGASVEFAAQAGLTAFALFAAATSAVHAFRELTGEEWKLYEAPTAPPRSVSAQAAAVQMDALG